MNLDTLEGRFDSGTVITLELLRQDGLVSKSRQPLKVLGRGELSKSLTVRAHKFSVKAAEKISAAGATVEVIS